MPIDPLLIKCILAAIAVAGMVYTLVASAKDANDYDAQLWNNTISFIKSIFKK